MNLHFSVQKRGNSDCPDYLHDGRCIGVLRTMKNYTGVPWPMVCRMRQGRIKNSDRRNKNRKTGCSFLLNNNEFTEESEKFQELGAAEPSGHHGNLSRMSSVSVLHHR